MSSTIFEGEPLAAPLLFADVCAGCMLLKRLYDTSLAQASYLIGCQACGVAIVIDPNRDVEQYVRAAADEHLRIAFVTETHIHADFASGARELARRTGATLLLSGEGGPEWQYAYAAEAGARLMRDGDQIDVGNIRLDVLHTPGHTPEHLTFLVTDTPATDKPMGAVTGDFIFVGDVGRPDLLERAAGVASSMDASARLLFKSLRRFAALPDYLQIWPGHGAGSACGKSLGAVPFSTLGYEKIANWAFAIHDEEDFVREVLAGQPDPPRYFAMMKRINREGPAMLGSVAPAARIDMRELPVLGESGPRLVDIRRTADFARGHVRGSLNIPLGGSFTKWAGWLLPYDRDLYLVAESPERARHAQRTLELIGLDRVKGWMASGDLPQAGEERVEMVPQLSVGELATSLEGEASGYQIVDVREASEWESGHIPGSRNIPLGHLGDAVDSLDRSKPIVLHCQTGSRSSIGASLLQTKGFRNVVNLAGGFAAWNRSRVARSG
jgi:hydroxyacylglutathione hydrolase